VDWTSEPEIGIARRYRLLHQAAYINATEKSGEEDREPVQRALQPTDENGWLTTDGVRNYRVCDTSATDFGKIGGAGLRVYFLLLKSLSLVSLACGVISLPAIFSYSTQEMYDQPEADAYAHLAGPARFGIGNIRVSETDIEAGKSCKICFSAPVIDLYTCNSPSELFWCRRGPVAELCHEYSRLHCADAVHALDGSAHQVSL
jgi:hypothetical protein